MLHAICDFCGNDCNRVGYFLTITPFQNFARYHTDTKIYGNQDETKSFVVCQDCFRNLNLPNPYEKFKTEKVSYTESSGLILGAKDFGKTDLSTKEESEAALKENE